MKSRSLFVLVVLALLARGSSPLSAAPDRGAFVERFCTSCHSSEAPSGRLDLSTLKFAPDDAGNETLWIKVFERVSAGEMPPKKKAQPTPDERRQFVSDLEKALVAGAHDRAAREGRSTRRRLNRYEYENAIRDLLDAPWLPLKEGLPEDSVAYGYNKIGEALDVSHVQMARYLSVADDALHQVVAHTVERPPSKAVRYYAREQSSFTRRMFFSAFNSAPERATFPILGHDAQPDVRSGTAPMTVGKSDPAARELEAVGLVAGAYEPIEPKFNNFTAPVSGHYKLRINALTVWVGPNGTQGTGTKSTKKWFIPNYDAISRGRRPEPITIYAEMVPRLLRRLGAFDAQPDASVHELDVWLRAGETIRPDASRLFRSRPGDVRYQNPLAERDGQPGVAYRWLEVEGPLYDQWPPAGHRLLLGDLPWKPAGKSVAVTPRDPHRDAERLLARFTERAYRRPVDRQEALRFLPVVEGRLQAGVPFAEALFAGYTAVLCSPEFITLAEKPGRLDDYALATRLALFLWNTVPDDTLRALAAKGELHRPAVLRAQTQRLLDDPRSRRFVNAFLDYWLDLRKITANSPDATLYNDYYLDDLLTESALEETQLYFAELLRANLPARYLVSSNFAMLNERLAVHYGVPGVVGVTLRKTPLPADSVRGGLLTQASVLSVTANGTTTSPVVRGAWIMERILGQPVPQPPSVPAVEPDLRGTTTIREQLARHRDQASCAVCHSRIDPPGFALESFDVMGGWRDRYRALAEPSQRETGLGKNGQPFAFRYGLPVDAGGELPDGRKFKDIREFKKLLLDNEPQLARNLVRQLATYATGARVGFGDRACVERILVQARPDDYGVASLIHALVQSDLFLTK